MYFFIFLNSANKFLKGFYIDKIIYTKLLTNKTNPTIEFAKIITLIILHNSYEKISLYLSYMNNT